ncbi:hypothetical protein K438DRAFT_1969576 [Mycena galopus ATCC 62051]|nr:hypothetical protein K438DRAFT_1969576 [Mycena galopus ATCC 62051]
MSAPPSTVYPAARDSVLVIIGAQDESANGRMKIAAARISRRCSGYALLYSTLFASCYCAAHAPVAHIVHITPLNAPIFTPDTPLAGIFPELAPLDRGNDASATDLEVLVPKRFPGSFAETILEDVIQRAGARSCWNDGERGPPARVRGGRC